MHQTGKIFMFSNIVLDVPLSNKQELDSLIKERCSSTPIVPELVEEREIRSPEAYNRFQDLEEKEAFQKKLLQSMQEQFTQEFGAADADSLINQFLQLAQIMEQDGALILGKMIDTESFQELITHYTEKLTVDGSKSWIHSYINLGNHPDFLSANQFNNVFLHPLLITLIAYSSGGPIRIVDARGKDAEPLAVQAQDNMLHIDNTPFRREFKIIVTWERGKPSGPKGQNFVFIPGTHKGARNCNIDEAGNAWSTEDGSIFTTPKAVQSIFDLQQKITGRPPIVVEVTHPEMPLTTIFEAGALVHHRYRTLEKDTPRSCIIMAFHRAQDNPGQFLSKQYLGTIAEAGTLMHLLMGKHSDNTEEQFIAAILATTKVIAEKIIELSAPDIPGTKIIPLPTRILIDELEKWKTTVTSAPTVEEIKIKNAYFQLGTELTHELLTEMMKYDKHGPLDLILYGDGHEEIRKWARNRIREMPLSRLENRVQQIFSWDLITAPSVSTLRSPLVLQKIAKDLVCFIDRLPTRDKAYLDKSEKITSEDAYRSLRQLIGDLAEAIVRCTSRQVFLSTSLFLFWANDELSRLLVGTEEQPPSYLMKNSNLLLSHYLTTYVLIEKQILMEQKQQTSLDLSKKNLSSLSLFTPAGKLKTDQSELANSTLIF
jgi:hypothetical protein